MYSFFLKPVLNWANVCSPEHTLDTSTNYDLFLNWTFSSPNMVRTVQTLLHSHLACNEMQASTRICGRRAADSMIENVGSSQVKSVYFHHSSQGNSTNYYLILGLRDKAAPSISQQINKFPSKRVKNLATPSSIFFLLFFFLSFFIHRRALLSANQRQWSSIRANVPRTCWPMVFGPRL